MLDPDHIVITKHALERYMERRGWSVHDRDAREDAETALRSLLRRCAAQNPPLLLKPGVEATRRYKQGGMVFITTPNSTVLKTMFHHEHRVNNKTLKGRQRK